MKKISPITIIKTLISCLILGVLFWQVDIPHLLRQLDRLTLPFTLFALCFYAGCQWLSCIRWQVILKSHGAQHSLGELFSSYFGGMFLNTFLPSSIGGDVYRVYRLSQSHGESEIAFVSVFLERITGVIALMGIALVAFVPAIQILGRPDILFLLLGCSILLGGAIALMSSPWVLQRASPILLRLKLKALTDKFVKIQALLIQFSTHHQELGLTLLLSLVLQLLLVFYYFLIAQQLDINISYGVLLIFIPIITIISMLPISLGGYGIKEGTVSYLFTRIGLSLEQALLFSISISFLGLLLSLPGAIVLLKRSPSKKLQNNKP